MSQARERLALTDDELPIRPRRECALGRRLQAHGALRESHRQALQHSDERGLHALDLAADLDALVACDALGECGVELDPSERSAEVELRSGAETDVRVRVARDVEGVGTIEDGLVAVRGGEPEDDSIAGADPLAADLDVLGRASASRSAFGRNGAEITLRNEAWRGGSTTSMFSPMPNASFATSSRSASMIGMTPSRSERKRFCSSLPVVPGRRQVAVTSRRLTAVGPVL